MYQKITGGALASTGVAIVDQVWFAIGLLVIGGTLLTLTRFGPRLAVEPVHIRRSYRWRLTVNGRPSRRR